MLSITTKIPLYDPKRSPILIKEITLLFLLPSSCRNQLSNKIVYLKDKITNNMTSYSAALSIMSCFKIVGALLICPANNSSSCISCVTKSLFTIIMEFPPLSVATVSRDISLALCLIVKTKYDFMPELSYNLTAIPFQPEEVALRHPGLPLTFSPSIAHFLRYNYSCVLAGFILASKGVHEIVPYLQGSRDYSKLLSITYLSKLVLESSLLDESLSCS